MKNWNLFDEIKQSKMAKIDLNDVEIDDAEFDERMAKQDEMLKKEYAARAVMLKSFKNALRRIKKKAVVNVF